jgi:hypothetical protein
MKLTRRESTAGALGTNALVGQRATPAGSDARLVAIGMAHASTDPASPLWRSTRPVSVPPEQSYVAEGGVSGELTARVDSSQSGRQKPRPSAFAVVDILDRPVTEREAPASPREGSVADRDHLAHGNRATRLRRPPVRGRGRGSIQISAMHGVARLRPSAAGGEACRRVDRSEGVLSGSPMLAATERRDNVERRDDPDRVITGRIND